VRGGTPRAGHADGGGPRGARVHRRIYRPAGAGKAGERAVRGAVASMPLRGRGGRARWVLPLAPPARRRLGRGRPRGGGASSAAGIGTVADLVPDLRPLPPPDERAAAHRAVLGRQVSFAAHLGHRAHNPARAAAQAARYTRNAMIVPATPTISRKRPSRVASKIACVTPSARLPKSWNAITPPGFTNGVQAAMSAAHAAWE
jgi:hypothetical protein